MIRIVRTVCLFLLAAVLLAVNALLWYQSSQNIIMQYLPEYVARYITSDIYMGILLAAGIASLLLFNALRRATRLRPQSLLIMTDGANSIRISKSALVSATRLILESQFDLRVDSVKISSFKKKSATLCVRVMPQVSCDFLEFGSRLIATLQEEMASLYQQGYVTFQIEFLETTQRVQQRSSTASTTVASPVSEDTGLSLDIRSNKSSLQIDHADSEKAEDIPAGALQTSDNSQSQHVTPEVSETHDAGVHVSESGIAISLGDTSRVHDRKDEHHG